MSEMVQCEVHGEGEPAYVCRHLVGGVAGQGFNRDEPSEEDPYPDAWCNDCEVIREAHGEWNDESQALVGISLLCSGCYEEVRIRNTRTDVTFDDLASLRWKCDSCEEWHTGPCLDFAYSEPFYWDTEAAAESPKSLLNEDLCVIDGEHFFVRGVIHLPIIGTAETFRWGVWGSLSEENFTKLQALFEDEKRAELPPMFSWLSSEIDGYESTLNMRMYAHIQEPNERPFFELERTDHQLSQEYHHGISAERVKEIMIGRLNAVVE